MNKPLFLTISEQIADNIRKSIIFGDLTEGMPLRETELSTRYSVSRGPVRDALRSLSNEGFLDMVPNVGVKVAKQPSKETLDLVIKLRKELENHVIEQVYDKFTEEEYEELEDLLLHFKVACESNKLHSVIDLDIEFHRFLVDKADDLHIRDLWQSVVNRMMFSYSRFGNLMESYDEHTKILEALRAKDKDLIIEVLDSNIQ